MKNRQIFGLVWLSVALSVIACAEEPPQTGAPPAPLFIYTFQTDSEPLGGEGLGLVVGIVNEAIRAAHKRFLTALESATSAEGAPDFMMPLLCPAAPCGPMVRAKSPLTDKVLIAALRADPSQAARVVEMRVIFDGRFLQVAANMYDASIGTGGKVAREHLIAGTYVTTYSKTLHEQDMRELAIDAPFSGKLGSKHARTHYWLAGSDPRLLREIKQSGELLAALRTARTSPDAPPALNDPSLRLHIPTLQKVVAVDSPSCKAMFVTYPVIKDLGEHLWLALPGSAGRNYPMTFYIARRCHYDY
jgi:hypothetical protein